MSVVKKYPYAMRFDTSKQVNVLYFET